jgi:hypothetical protein
MCQRTGRLDGDQGSVSIPTRLCGLQFRLVMCVCVNYPGGSLLAVTLARRLFHPMMFSTESFPWIFQSSMRDATSKTSSIY